MKRILKRRIIKILLFSFVISFIIYNIVWFCMIHFKYDAYVVGMEQSPITNKGYYLSKASTQYYVKYPDYLSFTGNLAVYNEDDSTSIIIWPSFLGDNEYGVTVEYNNQGYQIMVDGDINPIDENASSAVSANKSELLELWKNAKQQWAF